MVGKSTGKSQENKERFEIQTTEELDGVIYFSDKIEIEGSFVKFRPYKFVSKSGASEMKDMLLILPERCIASIVFREAPKPIE